MTNKTKSWVYFLLLLAILTQGYVAFAEAPASPMLFVYPQGQSIGLSWTGIQNAKGYTLYYAPYPGGEYVGEADLGDVREISFDLWPGAAFYVALKAYNEDGTGDFSNFEHFTIDSDETGTGGITLSAAGHPENTLMAVVEIETPEAASVYIEFSAENVESHQTAASQWGTRHEITVAGMRAETTYSLKAVAIYEDGTRATSQPVTFTTATLPEGAPTVSLISNQTGSSGGITFFGISQGPQDDSDTPTYWGVDEAGEIVWYLHGDTSASGTSFIRKGGTGELLTFESSAIRTVDAAGETVAVNNLQSAGRYHHDAVILPNGNVMALTNETGTFNGESLTGDRIVELDPDGRVVWEWSSFDHLDTGRFPGSLSRNESRDGSLDWSHANALFYIAEEDALLISFRSQSWVVKIDHATGNIIWIMGECTGISQGFTANFFTLTAGTWMSSQHAPLVTDSGEILIYDNRNETNGSTLNSRAVKYILDESNMTAVQTWEAVAPKYTFSLGDVDELDGGNVLISAGGPSGLGPGSDSSAHILEVNDAAPSETLWEITVDSSVYRAERIGWADFLGSFE